MKINNTIYFTKAITMLLMVMAFFVLSCEKKIVIKEPLLKKELPEREYLDYFALAEDYFHQEEYDKALFAYEQYLREFPKGEKARDARFKKAVIYYKNEKFDDSLDLLLGVIDKYPLERRASVHLLLAKTYFHLKRYPESRISALQWLELYKYYPGKEDVYFLLGNNLKELNEYPKAFYWWKKSFESQSISEEKREEIKNQILDLFYQASEEELKEMAVFAKESEFIAPIYYLLTLTYFSSGRLEKAHEEGLKVTELDQESEWVLKTRGLLEKIEERLMVDPNVVGCLLPLSGPFSIYGQEVLNGIELGFDIFQETNERLSLMELIVRDTEGDPEIGSEQLKEIIEKKAIITIGALISKVAEKTVKMAQEAGIPMITLSQHEGITEAGDMIFQNCLTPDDQIRSLVDKVLGEMGLRRFAILYPENVYGRYFMNKFWDKVESMGGEVTAVEAYDPKETDFSTGIKKIVGLFYPRPELDMEDEELEEYEIIELESEDEPEPIIDFDAIFIPDSFETVALIAPQLAFHDVVGVKLLGTNLWNSPKLIEIAGEYVRGAVFPAGFFSRSGYEGTKEFVELYNSYFGHEPGFFAALGYDTIRLVKDILREGDADIKTREDLHYVLTTTNEFNGLHGAMCFDQNRVAKRDPILLTIVGRHFFPVP